MDTRSARPIKVFHILHAFTAGGLENGVVNIINGSPDHLIHELCCLTEAGPFLERLKRPVTCHQLHRRPGNDPRLLFRIHQVIRRARPQVIHTRNWSAFDGVLASCFSPWIPLLHGEHGRDIADPHGLNRRRNRLRRLFSSRALRWIAVSQDLERWLAEVVRIPKRKLLLVPNGVDTARFRPRLDPDLRKELGILSGEFVVGTIGRLDPVKNHEGLIRAVAQLNSQNARVRLVIVGEGPHRPVLESLLNGLQCHPRPILTGPRGDVERFYGLFDVCVQNSFAEGMSNTLLESMAAGLPIVCTPVGGNAELISHEVHGIHVAAGDDAALVAALLRLQKSKHARQQYGERARKLVESRFSLSSMVQHYITLYEMAAEDSRGRGKKFVERVPSEA